MNSPKSIQVSIEVERGSFVKRCADGRIDFISPLPSPFAYGSVLGTFAPDGDPEDALVVGRHVKRGANISLPVWGQVRFIDGGVEDHKWVLSPQYPSEAQWKLIEHFFRVYAVSKRMMYLLKRCSGNVVFQGVERHPISSG